MKSYKNKWFTLVELLVVITIIGLLATLGIRQFSWAQQKARDTTRISSIKDLEWGIKQYYNDKSEYPESDKLVTWLKPYIPVLPKDPKTWKPTCAWTWSAAWGNTLCDYIYIAWPDENNMDNAAFELSSGFESTQSIEWKAVNDNWNCPYRLEVWDKYSEKTWNTTNGDLKTTCLPTSSDDYSFSANDGANSLLWSAGAPFAITQAHIDIAGNP